MKRYFLNEDAELCYKKEQILDHMRMEGLSEITVLEAIPVKSKDTEYMYCRYIGQVGEKGECGKSCDTYIPRNGINGICKYQGILFEHGEEVVIKLNK